MPPLPLAPCIISTLLNQFRSFYPQAALKVFIDTPTRLANGLARNDLDIALVETMPSNSELVYEPFLDDTMVLVCSPDHPFAKTGRATLTQISQENYIARESNSREIFAEYMELHNHPLNATWFCNNSETTKQAVAHNYGITVISRRIVASELENGSLVEIQMENCQINANFGCCGTKTNFLPIPLLDFIGSMP